MQEKLEAWKGFLACGLIGLVSMIASILQQVSWHMCSRSARQVWLAASAMIFKKPAMLSSGARSDITDGELVNMMTVDAVAVLNFMQFFAIFATAPMFILVPSVVVFYLLGWPFIVGFVIFCLTSILCDLMARRVQKLQRFKLMFADKRNTRLNESFQGIRTVKLNAWEDLVEQRVEKERRQELGHLKDFQIWQSLQQSFGFGMPTLATVSTFMLWAHAGGDLDPAVVMMSVSLLEFLGMGTNVIPHMFNMIRQTKLNFDRMGKLLVKDDDYVKGQSQATAGCVRCEAADFRWQLEKQATPSALAAPGVVVPMEDKVTATATLSDVSLAADPGEMIAICGRVGSGKTTWAGGLLGTVSRTKGSVELSGTVAYVTQSPQILNASFKENILFGSDMDEDWYKQVLEACALNEDLAQFKDKDNTEIGERGITISGGQKQRVAIARAAYSRSDVFIFDDPLSAMDAHVGRQVFENCFLNLLASKTRVFFTNQLQFCSDCSQVYMLEGGRVVESGSYGSLIDRSPPGPFGNFLQSMVGNKEAQEGDLQEQAGPDAAQETVPEPQPDKNPATSDAKTDSQQSKEVENEPAIAKPAKAETAKATPSTQMSKETKIAGRIGIRDWMVIARASDASCLGVLVIVAVLLAPLIQYSVNFFLSLWTDALMETGQGAFADMTPSILFMSSAAAFGVSLFFRGVICVTYFLKSSGTLHRAMLATTLRQTMGWFDTTPVGRVLNRFGNDVNFMDVFLPMLFQMWSLMAGRVVIIVAVAAITAPPSLLLCLGLLFAGRTIYGYYGAIALDMQRLQMMALSPLIAAQSSFLGALDTIRTFDRVDIFLQRFHRQQRDFIKCYYWSFSIDRAMQAIFTAFAVSVFYSGLSAIILALALYDTPLKELVTPGNAGLILAYSSMLAMLIPVMIYMTARIESMMAAVQRVAEYKNLKTEEAMQQAPQENLPEEWPSKGKLVLQDVKMRYAEGHALVLKGVSFEVKSGERVGIVGRTGSGKSSILLSCFRMVEAASGRISIDGYDIAKAPLQRLRHSLGVIPQDSWLFSGTIRSNLDVYSKHSDAELWTVLQHSHLEEQVKALEGGLDAEVREKGENLSAGTSQLLCLARVLLKKPMLLFMDEATASVDSESDTLVQETLRKPGVLPSGCSIVTIAHRLQTIIDYDKIVVLSHGEVVEMGSPAELLENDRGHFSGFVKSTGEASAKELRRRSVLASMTPEEVVEA
eukprot:TRINITY_DN63837_c0_g1_i1.p1 TRINITY_DN63837_c0_g1~~TRINITY_DN63837_c0_g1_i1.p1  ORF type:complete len:1348 (-),score=274.07 TRINITY_DN63837_c0_g1_i1:64-3729(-)